MDLASDLVALIAAPPGAVVARPDGAVERVSLDRARELFTGAQVLVAHAGFVAGRLGLRTDALVFDVLELFSFVRPGIPFVPSALGLARVLGLDLPRTVEESARSLHAIARVLLEEAAGWSQEVRAGLAPLVGTMDRFGWRWAGYLKPIVGEVAQGSPIAGLQVWRTLPQWEDRAPVGQPGSQPITAGETRACLDRIVGVARPEQAAYSEAAAYAFGPRDRAGAPRLALVEAGTGTGKTLGYLAPASVWAQKNGPGLWISTYTRNLQRQIVQEIARLWPDPVERAQKAVVRKGRENYLCLLNFEEAAKRTALAPGARAIALGLIARWISTPTDGDLSGVGFPAFLAAIMPLSTVTDRRGECIYSACPHYRICFVERVIRRARHADIVVANHALVIAQAAQDGPPQEGRGRETDKGDGEKQQESQRLRYVFDEGHHLFDAADSGFSAMLSGREMAELRRWICGPGGKSRSRMRGLDDRLKDLVADDSPAQALLEQAVHAAGSALVGDGWTSRLGALPRGPGEKFLAATYQHVRARSDDRDVFYSKEAESQPMTQELLAAVAELSLALGRIADPLVQLARVLRKKSNDKTATLEPSTKARLEAAARGLERRGKLTLPAWIAMLETLINGEIPEEFVDWFEILREEGRDRDVGLRRHWIDPTKAFAAAVLEPAHGALITSATLRDIGQDSQDGWTSAEVRTGAGHLPQPARRAHFGSPFHYEDQARIFIVNDVIRRDPDALAAAYRELFLAAGGGGLGLFTAVRALRETAQRIAAPLAQAGLSLYAQHIDKLDTGSLVDLFRAEENACLLGTDALRDGVDVPGRSLRLVVFDKVPWPKPTILHKARRAKFGKGYDDLITRFRLKQAFGRLIRGPQDRGCFIILEGATPSRLLTAFPEKTPVKRCGLAEAIKTMQPFLVAQDHSHKAPALLTG